MKGQVPSPEIMGRCYVYPVLSAEFYFLCTMLFGVTIIHCSYSLLGQHAAVVKCFLIPSCFQKQQLSSSFKTGRK